MKKIVFSFLVVATILVAGCVGGGEGPSLVEGTGLEIIDFAIEPMEVRSTKAASFIITAENQGDSEIEKNYALFKIILPSDWTLTTPSTGYSALDKDMLPEDPSTERAADVVTERFRASAPSLSRGQTRTDDVTIRAYYDYVTDSNGIVYLYPYGEDREEATNFVSDNAPIRLGVTTSPAAPVIEDAGDYFTLVIDIENVGSGKVHKPKEGTYTSVPTIGSDDYNKVNITIDIKGGSGMADEHGADPDPNDDTPAGWDYWLMDNDCAGRGADEKDNMHEWELYGKTNPKTTIMCDVKVNKAVITTKTPLAIVVNATYGYYTEVSDSISILGR